MKGTWVPCSAGGRRLVSMNKEDQGGRGQARDVPLLPQVWSCFMSQKGAQFAHGYVAGLFPFHFGSIGHIQSLFQLPAVGFVLFAC